MKTNDPKAEHSGRLTLRMPRGLHDEIARQAHEENSSLNQIVVALLAGGLGWRGDRTEEAPLPGGA